MTAHGVGKSIGESRFGCAEDRRDSPDLSSVLANLDAGCSETLRDTLLI